MQYNNIRHIAKIKRCLRLFLTLIIINVFLLSACKKMLEVDLPINSITTKATFSDDKGATSAVLGIYAKMAYGNGYDISFANSAITILCGMSSDELIPVNTLDIDLMQFQQNTIFINNLLNESTWQKAYSYLYQANACIEGLETSDNISAKNQLLGECKFLRAFILFYLTNLYGDVAMPLSTDWRINSIIPRSNQAKVYEQIIKDLKEAETLLNDNYPVSEKIRVNKFTATALLARIYLYNDDWVNAESSVSSVINSTLYSLEPNPDSAFLKESKEVIFELKPVIDGPMTAVEGFKFLFNFDNSFYCSNELLSSFEANDKRKICWLTGWSQNGIDSFFIPYKYKWARQDDLSQTTEYNVVLRLAEQYLIRAEARARQNKLHESISDLNSIRFRAGLPELPDTLNLEQVISAVEQERRIELMAEWGHRWLDLKRTAKVDAILAPLKPEWGTTDKLYPLPESELLLNPRLTQNPGY